MIGSLAYLAFPGCDREKDLDPVTGSETGPYEAWQVVGPARRIAGCPAVTVASPPGVPATRRPGRVSRVGGAGRAVSRP
ncbi:hypothetical protein GA0074694_2348 [Micromonospora inyonensis]|uniref:Uncharacterized protein n=1 Tax=Micromonospora inyonensis TaxID=47866 RepID=A0A1C6RMP3_9ACTN|nr:hypothetical protein GA0074694_2348 [Micromonospora inyonensis]